MAEATKGALLVAGTTSDAGKTVVVAGLCRLLHRRGIRVAPFKAQNMSLNSTVTEDGAEIGRAQAFQAFAAGIDPTAAMNPVLLKPMDGNRSQVIVLGSPVGVFDARAYGAETPTLLPVVLDALDGLRRSFDVVLLEGAGGAAEINLLDRDIVNLPLARAAGIPVVVVGDIERGGVFASLYGTHALLPPELRAYIRGFLINKMRGDVSLLGDGPAQLEARTGVPVLGVLPHLDGVTVDDEDSLALARGWSTGRDDDVRVDVAVVRFPHVSNITDLDPLRVEPGVRVRLVSSAHELGRPDLVVLPGTRTTVHDLTWLRASGFDRAVRDSGAVVLGICGGYQMLGTRIRDDVESGAGVVEGLGWLDVETTFQPEKVLRRHAHGYEIHHGVVNDDAVVRDEGRVLGTSVHGLLEDDERRRALLARITGVPWPSTICFDDVRSAQADRLADLLDEHADVDALVTLLR